MSTVPMMPYDPHQDPSRDLPAGKRILAFAGRNGCGKETAAKTLAKLLGGVKTHTYSDILQETFMLWDFPRERNSRPDLQKLSEFMRDLKGQDAMARVMAKKCRETPSAWVVIDGVRRLEDLDLLNEEFGQANIFLIWVEASADNRYARLKQRKEKAGEEFKTRKDFDQEELAESERQLDAVRAACVREIDNNGTLQALNEQLIVLHHDLVIGPVA